MLTIDIRATFARYMKQWLPLALKLQCLQSLMKEALVKEDPLTRFAIKCQHQNAHFRYAVLKTQ